jgi:hypothetical protein
VHDLHWSQAVSITITNRWPHRITVKFMGHTIGWLEAGHTKVFYV